MADLPAVGLTPAGFASVMPATTHIARIHVPLPPLDSPKWQSPFRAFAWGMRSVASTVLTLGLALFPLAAMLNSGVDILVSGVSAGTIAYGVHRWRARP
jgi:hypothetical protein